MFLIFLKRGDLWDSGLFRFIGMAVFSSFRCSEIGREFILKIFQLLLIVLKRSCLHFFQTGVLF